MESIKKVLELFRDNTLTLEESLMIINDIKYPDPKYSTIPQYTQYPNWTNYPTTVTSGYSATTNSLPNFGGTATYTTSNNLSGYIKPPKP